MEFAAAYSYRLDWIASFVAVARTGGFSAAAKAQYRSQPRISSHISELERVLGATLFDRSVQPAALTPEGRALLPHAEEILSRLAAFAEVSAEAGGVVRGEIRVGMYPSVAAFLYPPLVRRLQRDTPAVRAVLREGDTLTLESLLVNGDVELAVRPLLPLVKDDRLAHLQLWREPLVAVVPPGHRLAGLPSVRLAEVASHPLVTIGEPVDGARQFETNLAFAEAGIQAAIAFQTNQPQTLAALVREGLGVGVTNMLAMLTADRAGLDLVPIADSRVQRCVALWWRADRPASAAVAAVRDALTAMPRPGIGDQARG